MNLHKLIFTNNACYKAGKTIMVKGIMVHSTGANNPWLKRYVGPDDGYLGVNQYNNHWNQAMDRDVCVHGFIGKLKDGSIATYQTLPWNMRGWHAGGSANNTHIGFEICEDGLTDSSYFSAVYKEAVELCVYLCKQYNLTEKNIICHCEGYKQGVASNHGDVLHWWPKFGKNMDTFRAAVKEGLASDTADTPVTDDTVETPEQDGEIGEGSVVAFKASATTYSPGGATIPNWVKTNWYHKVTQTTSRGKDVVKGGAKCVLLGKKRKKDGGDFVAGINTWVAVDNLTLVDGETSTTTEYRVHTVVKGDTLWGIAAKYLGSGGRYGEIVSLNGLKSNVIITGQKLNIPN